jgi:hypothetical protein
MAVRLWPLHVGLPLLPGNFVVLIPARGWVDPRAILKLQLLNLKNPTTSPEIETRGHPACSKSPQQTTLPRAPTHRIRTTLQENITSPLQRSVGYQECQSLRSEKRDCVLRTECHVAKVQVGGTSLPRDCNQWRFAGRWSLQLTAQERIAMASNKRGLAAVKVHVCVPDADELLAMKCGHKFITWFGLLLWLSSYD